MNSTESGIYLDLPEEPGIEFDDLIGELPPLAPPALVALHPTPPAAIITRGIDRVDECQEMIGTLEQYTRYQGAAGVDYRAKAATDPDQTACLRARLRRIYCRKAIRKSIRRGRLGWFAVGAVTGAVATAILISAYVSIHAKCGTSAKPSSAPVTAVSG